MSSLELEQPVPASGAARAAAPVEPPMARRVAWNSLWLAGQPLFLNLLSILSIGYIARKLGASDFGAFTIGFAQATLFAQICYLGLRQVAIRAVAEDREDARAIAGSVLTLRVFCTLLAVILTLAWLSRPIYSLPIRLLGLASVLSMLVTSLGTVAVDLFYGFERPRLAAQAQVAGGVILTVLSVLALASGAGLPGFAAAYVVGALIQTALLFAATRRHLFPLLPTWDVPRLKDLARQARPFALLSLMKPLAEGQALDVLILGALFVSSEVGPYAAAVGLVARLQSIPDGIVDATFPAVANGYSTDRAGVDRTVWRYVLNVLMFTVPAAVCLSFTAPTVLWILFGSQYLSGADPLRVAAWLLPLYGVNHLARNCMAAVRQQDLVLRQSIASAALLLVLFAVLIPTFGPLGAALAGVLRETIMLAVWLPALRRFFQPPALLRDLAKIAVAQAAMAAPLLLASAFHNHLLMVLAAVLGAAAYAGAGIALGLVDRRVLRVLDRFKPREAKPAASPLD